MIPNESDQLLVNGLRIYTIAAALIAVSPDFFKRHETDARATLAQVTDASEILPVLLERGHTTIAGRLAGAFKNIKRMRVADDIVKAMKAAGHDIRISDPFLEDISTILPPEPAPPHVNRLRLMWMDMRNVVIDQFPPSPGRHLDIEAFMQSVEDTYVTDAYHSLSIEGYQVSKALVERIQRQEWDPDAKDSDRHERDAMAAKGYRQAFLSLKISLMRVLTGENPGLVAEENHGDWYRELFTASVTAGIIKASDLAGYRNGPVFIRNSRHVPPRSEAVRDLMPIYFDLLGEEEDAAVRVVLGHFFFVNIHPYSDGNGRIGRFLMNLMLTAGGYPWIVIPVEKRSDYMNALEQASIKGDIASFTRFLASRVVDSS
jgi:hypothetical protein